MKNKCTKVIVIIDHNVYHKSKYLLFCYYFIIQRINEHLDRTGGLSPNPFGFRSSRSTEDAISKILATAIWATRGYSQYQDLCILVALDVKKCI